MTLREQFKKDTDGEWLPPYSDMDDELEAELAYSNWLEARDEEHLTKIEKEVRHRKRYQQKCTDLLSEAKKMEKDLAFSVKYRNKLEKALFEGGEHPELPTLKQFIEDAPRVWYSHKSERALRCGQMYSDRVMIDQGWVKVALLELPTDSAKEK